MMMMMVVVAWMKKYHDDFVARKTLFEIIIDEGMSMNTILFLFSSINYSNFREK